MNGQVQPTTCEHGVSLLASCQVCQETLDVRIISDAIVRHRSLRLTGSTIRAIWAMYSESINATWAPVPRLWSAGMVSTFLSWSRDSARGSDLSQAIAAIADVDAKERTKQELQEKAAAQFERKMQEGAARQRQMLFDPSKFAALYGETALERVRAKVAERQGVSLLGLNPDDYVKAKPSATDRQALELQQDLDRIDREALDRLNAKTAAAQFEQVQTAARRWMEAKTQEQQARYQQQVDAYAQQFSYAGINRAQDSFWRSNGPSAGPTTKPRPAAPVPVVSAGPRRYFDE